MDLLRCQSVVALLPATVAPFRFIKQSSNVTSFTASSSDHRLNGSGEPGWVTGIDGTALMFAES